MRRFEAPLRFLLLLTTGTLCAMGQEVTATMLGIVTDQADAVIPKATLTATELATGNAHTATSDEAGLFRFNDLPPGKYKLLIRAPGFKAYDLTGIELATAETRNLGKQILQIGAVSDEVTVTAASTPVQTASSERADSVTPSQLNDIALKGRDPFSFVQLLPGVVDSLIGGRDIENAYSMGSLQINGANAQSVNVLMDGITEMDEGGNYTAFVTPNVDSISEMRILTNGYAAEYGRQSGGTMNVITKSGGSSFHGTGHWDHRNEGLNANTFFNNRSGIQRPIYRYLILGYSVGGPVYIPKLWNRSKNRLFFFMSQEFTKTDQSTVTVATNEPTALELGGNFSNSRNASGAVIPVLMPGTTTPFPGNIIPPSLFDPTGAAILGLLPKPSGYVNPAPGQQYTSNFLASETPTYNRRNTIMRFDANITSKLNMYYRWGQDVDNHEFPFVVSPGVGTNVNFLPGYVHGVHLT
ncbi:MAG TPA: TonB-dependent receptor, partial [Chthoniobacterales bacterium]